MYVSSWTWGTFCWYPGFGAVDLLLQVLDSNSLLGVHLMKRQALTLKTDVLWMYCSRKQRLNEKRWPEKHSCMNVAHCAGPCVFDGDGCVHIEGGYDSLHPLDQWLGFGEQPSLGTETPTWKPSQTAICSAFLHCFESLRELKYCKCNTLLSKDQSLLCPAWQQSHCCGPSFLEQTRHACPVSLQTTSVAVGTLVWLLHHRKAGPELFYSVVLHVLQVVLLVHKSEDKSVPHDYDSLLL